MKNLTIFLLFIFLLFLTACGKKNIRNKFEFYKIEEEKTETNYTGIVKFQHTASLSFQEDGVISYLNFSIGDFVKKGAVLAKIDSTLYKIKQNEERAYLAELETKYKQAESYFKRMDILHKSGAVSDNDWEAAGYDKALKAKEITLQKEKINYINKQINYTTLYSPFDGFVFEKTGEVGEYVSAGKTVITIIASSQTQVEIMVTSDIINNLKLNQAVTLFNENNTYKGHIAHISQSSTDSGGYIVKILLEKFYPELKEGMNLDVKIPELSKSSIFIPIYAIIFENNKKYVYKVEKLKDNSAQIKKTEIISGKIFDNEMQEVIKGLNKGDLIILRGKKNLKDNEKIEL